MSYHRTSLTTSALSSLFLDRLLPPLRRVFSFVIFLWPSVDDHGSPVIFRSVSVRPTHLFDPISDHDYSFKLPLAKERDAHSLGRRSTARHVRYRAVPRANRMLPTAHTPNRSATSNTVEPPVSGP